jgi:hypothetical protein
LRATAIDVVVVRGILQLSCADFEGVFGRAAAVVLVREHRDLWILPVHEAAIGGHLVKLRNAAGDRAIDALELFRGHELELERDREIRVTGRWVPERGALQVADLFA